MSLRFRQLKENFEQVSAENQTLFDRHAADIADVNLRQTDHKAAADTELAAVRELVAATAESFGQRLSGLAEEMTDKLEASTAEAEKNRARLAEDIEDIRGRLDEHDAKHEKAEAGLRLHEKAIEDVRQGMIDRLIGFLSFLL